MKRKVFEARTPVEIKHEIWMPLPQFDALVDEGYDDVLIITPLHRYLVSLDDFLDYGYLTNNGETEVYALGKAYIGLA